jgi:hypothetical protein
MPMKPILLAFLIVTATNGLGQSIVGWSTQTQLNLRDFQSPQTEINEELRSYSLFSGTNMDFSFQMSTYEFMFTKNFNSKIRTTFNKKAAIIIAPDSATALQLVNFGQYSFDLTELYTRKFRQKIYEEKGAFSDVNFFKPIFEELQQELNAESARVLKITDLGRKAELLMQEHQIVVNQIEQLSDFCFDCKPPKKKGR